MDQDPAGLRSRFGAADAAAYKREYGNSVAARPRAQRKSRGRRARIALGGLVRAVRSLVGRRPEAGR